MVHDRYSIYYSKSQGRYGFKNVKSTADPAKFLRRWIKAKPFDKLRVKKKTGAPGLDGLKTPWFFVPLRHMDQRGPYSAS